MKKAFLSLVLLLGASSAHALTITGGGINGLGSFEAEVTYEASADGTTAVITFEMTNTTDAALDGYITGFAFNNPDDLIQTASLSTAPVDSWQILGTDAPDGDTVLGDSVDGAPFGYFDLGATTDTSVPYSWEGGGTPSLGLAAGETAVFTFSLTGADLNSLSLMDFFGTATGEYSSAPASDDHETQVFAVRFRGFSCEDDPVDPCEGSDKAPGVVPIPGAAALFLTGLGFLGWLRRRQRTA